MIGAVLVVIALVVAIPVAVIISGGILAGVIGQLLCVEGDKGHKGSELLDLHH